MTISNYNRANKEFARGLRNNSTLGEILLWDKLLKNKKMLGYQFNRQFAIGNYIADFICRKLKLIVEVDGSSHDFKFEQDKVRDNKLADLGYITLRISDQQVKYDIKNVQRIIEQKIKELEEVNPLAPFKKGERETN